MTTTTWTSTPANSSDALFRAWGKGLSDAIAAVGFVRTADTGQIDWTTVAFPTAANTQQGYEVYRFNDALQTTVPLFFRVGYGSGLTNGSPSIWLTVGKGSNGTGSITSTLTPSTQTSWTGTGASSVVSYASSGDGSLLVVGMFLGAANSSLSKVVLIERSRSSMGAATGTGVLCTSGPTVRTANYQGTYTYPPSHRWPVAMPVDSNADTTLSTSGKAPVFAATVTDGMGNFWQPRSVLVGMRSDIGSFSSFTVPDWGTYMGCGAGVAGWDGQAGSWSSPAIRWE